MVCDGFGPADFGGFGVFFRILWNEARSCCDFGFPFVLSSFRVLWNEATVLLELPQGGESFVETALGGGHEALDDGHHFQNGEHAVLVVAGNEFRFVPAVAADAPDLFGHFVDQNLFRCVGGVVVAAQIGSERFEFGGIFYARNDQIFGVETVLKSVLAAGGFTFNGAGSGAVLGVGAVGFGAILFGGLALGGATELSGSHATSFRMPGVQAAGKIECKLLGAGEKIFLEKS
jgi:hypothetical protein